MILTLACVAVLMVFLGAAYELSLLTVSQAELAAAVNRRLRGEAGELRPTADTNASLPRPRPWPWRSRSAR